MPQVKVVKGFNMGRKHEWQVGQTITQVYCALKTGPSIIEDRTMGQGTPPVICNSSKIVNLHLIKMLE